MLDFLTGIGEFFESIVLLVSNLVNSILDLFKWIGKALQYISNVAPYLPASLAGIALVFITVAVVYLIVGR